LATLAQLLHQVLEARHPIAVLVLGALAEESLQGAEQIALFEEVI